MKEIDIVSKNFENIAKSYSDGRIDSKDLNDFKKAQAVEYQPNFVDILYLQLKTIGNLWNSINALD